MAKILLVDDDALLVRMYQTKLKADGFEVETAADGSEGFNKAKLFKPDLILLDVMMPKLNGFEMLGILKQNLETKRIPVILLTNVGGSEAEIEKGLSLGAVAYIIKADYVPKEIVQKIKEILAGYKQDLPEVKTVIKPTTQ
jgi:DNA-binding response OmpR family regulator